MYFGWLHKETPENWRINVLKKSYLGRFRVLEFFSTTRNNRIFFRLGLWKSIISAWTYVFWLVTQENTRKLANQCPQIKLFGSVLGSRIFSTSLNDHIFISFRVLKKYHISINLCILVRYTRKHRKLAY